MKTGLAGEAFTQRQRDVLLDEIANNKNLTVPERAGLAEALQNDLADKQKPGIAQAGLNPNTLMIPGASAPTPVCIPQLLAQPTVVTPQPPVIGAESLIQPPPSTTETEPSEAVYGLKVTELTVGGPAEVEGMRLGDVILKVNGKETPTFEVLRSILSNIEGEVEVVYINGETGELEAIDLEPKDGLLGIWGVEIRVE